MLATPFLALLIISQAASFLGPDQQAPLTQSIFRVSLKRDESKTFSPKTLFDFLSQHQSYVKTDFSQADLELLDTSAAVTTPLLIAIRPPKKTTSNSTTSRTPSMSAKSASGPPKRSTR